MTSTPTSRTGVNVRGEMARKGITQAQIAEALDLSQAAVSSRVRGLTPFDINELATIAALLEIPIERLIEGVAA